MSGQADGDRGHIAPYRSVEVDARVEHGIGRVQRGAGRVADVEARADELLEAKLPWQLRPHFVFNALNSIALLTRNCERERTLALVTSLGDLLQHSLETQGRPVTLEREVSFARRYLDVERLRYDRPLSVQSELEAGAMDALVPSFVLQPVVEDMIRHTLDPDASEWFLTIRARVLGACLEIEARSPSSPGSHPRTLSYSKAFGITELRERLEGEYGNDYRLVVVSDPSGALIARLRIPHIPAGGAEALPTGSAATLGC